MLTSDQLGIIDQHLRSRLSNKKWFRQEEFIAEMTDHYIGSILAHTSQGDTFNVALAKTDDNFGQADGLKRLEMNYWKLSSREMRSKLPQRILIYFTFPHLFISLPLIAGLLFIKTQAGIPFYTVFPILLLSCNLSYLLSWLFRKRSWYFGAFQPFVQRIAGLFHCLTEWASFIFVIELFSNPMFVGEASPYLATFLYTAGVLIYLAVRDLIKPTLSV